MADDELLATYLNDHHAGGAGARDLIAKSAANNEGTALGGFLSSLLTAIEEDIAALEDIMERLGVPQAALKQAAGRVAEKLSRLKLHERVVGDAGVSQLMELEALSGGITAKAALWRTLTELAHTDARLAGVDLQRLSGRGRDQLQQVAEHHRQVAATTFGR